MRKRPKKSSVTIFYQRKDNTLFKNTFFVRKQARLRGFLFFVSMESVFLKWKELKILRALKIMFISNINTTRTEENAQFTTKHATQLLKRPSCRRTYEITPKIYRFIL